MGLRSERVPVVVIGAGVLGCAIALELVSKGLTPWVLEAGAGIAEGVTSRNSGVVHAGLYYPPGSLKAESCIEGNRLLYERCERKGVPFRRLGKWIIGKRSEEGQLTSLLENATSCGVRGLRWATRGELAEKLPGVSAEVALFSEETGIVDPLEYSQSFRVEAEEKGAVFFTRSRVTSIEKDAHGFRLETSRGEVKAENLVNAAGLYADEVASMIGITSYRIHPCRGDYFRLKRKLSATGLVYPVKAPRDAGLGVHLTQAFDGSWRLGPDARYVGSREDFSAPADLEVLRERFIEAAGKYLPHLRAEELSYDTCGIRPKLRSPTDSAEKDFVVAQDLPGLVNCVGIESPGLTASASLARRVVKIFTG